MIDVNKYFLRRKIKKILNSSNREKKFHNLKEVKTVLLLFDVKDYSDASLFIKQLKKMGKKVNVYAYQDKKDKTDYSKIVQNIVTEKDMNIWKDDSLKELVNSLGTSPYDLTVALTPEENILLQYIVVSADSLLKVGFSKTNLPIYDLVISVPSEEELGEIITTKELSKQLIHYLTTISSNTQT